MTILSDQSSLPAEPRIDARWLRRFRQRLRNWYRKHARTLPWRTDPDPYRVWVSEIMLQQTQVATVVAYYHRFLKRFPDLNALADADEQEVLRLWEGLGYYRRARQLHRAAIEVVKQHNGVFPSDRASLLALPGIGRYTAGAILSIAFGQREPILEANTIRLLSRLLLLREETTRSDSQRRLWELAELLLPAKDLGSFNQALMELGSLVCTPQNPACYECPIQEICPAFEQGLQETIPVMAAKQAITAVREAAVIIRDKSCVLLRQCSPQERWAGLWDFPRFEIRHQRGQALARELQENVFQLTGLQVTTSDCLKVIKHSVTRYRITLSCYQGQLVSRDASKDELADRAQWVPITELEDYPLSVTGRKICQDLLN